MGKKNNAKKTQDFQTLDEIAGEQRTCTINMPKQI
jgi:hypothetical protein